MPVSSDHFLYLNMFYKFLENMEEEGDTIVARAYTPNKPGS